MKKMWKLAVVALAAFAFVACGGSTEKKAKNVEEGCATATTACDCTAEKKAEPSVKDYANEFAQKMCNAAKSNDVAKVEKLENEIDKYVDGLDEEKAEEFEQAFTKKCAELASQAIDEFGL